MPPCIFSYKKKQRTGSMFFFEKKEGQSFFYEIQRNQNFLKNLFFLQFFKRDQWIFFFFFWKEKSNSLFWLQKTRGKEKKEFINEQCSNFFFRTLPFFRDDRIRTCDTMLPKHMRYQAALHPVYFFFSRRKNVDWKTFFQHFCKTKKCKK